LSPCSLRPIEWAGQSPSEYNVTGILPALCYYFMNTCHQSHLISSYITEGCPSARYAGSPVHIAVCGVVHRRTPGRMAKRPVIRQNASKRDDAPHAWQEQDGNNGR